MQRALWNGLGLTILLVTAALYAFMSGWPSAEKTGPENLPPPVVFYCEGEKRMEARFDDRTAALSLSDGRTLSLARAVSGSGARYEATTTRTVLVTRGDSAFLEERDETTYRDCVAAHVGSARAGYLRYEDFGGSFSFEFPEAFRVAGIGMGLSTEWSMEAITTGELRAKIIVPREFEPGTNFGESWFTVGTSAGPDAAASCLAPAGGPLSSSEDAEINGVPFRMLRFVGAAAGNRYDTTSYRTVYQGACWALEYVIHSGNIGNYPAGSVEEFDEARVRAALEEMARSFRFTPTLPPG